MYEGAVKPPKNGGIFISIEKLYYQRPFTMLFFMLINEYYLGCDDR